MSGDPKYVVIDEALFPTIYVFPETVQHRDFVFRMGLSKDKVLSAGFVNMRSRKCYGKSVSLGIESDPTYDGCLLKRMYFNNTEE